MTNELTPIDATAGVIAGHDADQWQHEAAVWLGNLQSERTRRLYLHAWRRFSSFVNKHPADVGRGDLVAYRNHMKASGYAAATTAQHMSAVSSFYRHAVEVGLLYVNPVAGVKWPKVEAYAAVKTAVAPLVDGDGDLRLLASIDGDTVAGARDKAIILLLLGRGLRVAEVCGLRVGDYDGRYLQLLRKGKEDRTAVAIGADIAGAVGRYLALRGSLSKDAPLFVATDAGRAAAVHLGHDADELRPLSVRAVRQMITRRCNRVFGPGHGITPHTLRHALATRADGEGAALTEISDMMGHRSTRITHTYLHATGGRGDRLARRMASRYAEVA